jgi:acyl-coenzyme A synthetase/AMP-(fatty) acid ligase
MTTRVILPDFVLGSWPAPNPGGSAVLVLGSSPAEVAGTVAVARALGQVAVALLSEASVADEALPRANEAGGSYPLGRHGVAAVMFTSGSTGKPKVA